MNVLIYFGNQLNPNNGGTERVACFIAEYLHRKGYKIHYLACRPSEEGGSLESLFLPDKEECPTKKNVEYLRHLISEKSIDVIINEGAYGESSYLFSHEYISAKVKIISHIHFDPVGDDRFFYRTLNLPIVGNGFNSACVSVLKWCKAPYNRLVNRRNKKARLSHTLEMSDKVVFLTEDHIKDLKKIVQKGAFNKTIAIKNPITFDKPATKIIKQNEIVFVGRLDYASKRVDRILRIWSSLFQLHKDWKLTIVGDGKDRRRLENLSQKLKLERVDFIGRTDPMPIYARAKILLMTSNYEGCPMVIQEAMAFGAVPVVMNNFSGASYMILDEVNGRLAKSMNINDMIRIISELIEVPSELRRLSENAVSAISALDNNTILSEWDNLIRE